MCSENHIFSSTSSQDLLLVSPQSRLGGGYFRFQSKNQPQNCKKHAILHTFQANGGGAVAPFATPPSYATGSYSVFLRL